jgi:hypothetical protein
VPGVSAYQTDMGHSTTEAFWRMLTVEGVKVRQNSDRSKQPMEMTIKEFHRAALAR